MKVFISWSGDQSHKLATCLIEWLPNVIQRAHPFISSEIDKGARWSSIIAKELNDTDFGILCVTGENIKAPWLLFEAGAISKSLDHARVAPILVGITKDALSGNPLSQFQLSELTRNDILSVVKSLNKADTADPLSERRLNEAFDAFWPKLEAAIEAGGLATAAPATATAETASAPRAETTNEDEADTPEARIRAATAATFGQIAEDIAKGEDFRSDRDFWTALFASRRHELAITSDDESVDAMRQKAPNAFWPAYFATSAALAAGDLKAARQQAEALPTPPSPRAKTHLERLQVDLAAQLPNLDDGLSVIRTVLSGPASDPLKADAVERFAAKHESNGSDLAACMLREYAIRLKPADQHIQFNLARKLAASRQSATVAFDYYERIRVNAGPLGPNSTHNMAVIASGRGLPALMYRLYEESEKQGVLLSTINLATSIANSGDLSRARERLNGVENPAPYKQNYDSALQSLGNAEVWLSEQEKTLRAAAKSAHAEFARFSDIGVRAWLDERTLRPGDYRAETKGLRVDVSDQGDVSATLVRGDKTESGTLKSNGLSYEGMLTPDGAAAGAFSRGLQITPLHADEGDLQALLWGGPLPNAPVELVTLERMKKVEPAQAHQTDT